MSTPKEFFQKYHSNEAWASNMDSPIMEAARNITLAILSAKPEFGRREMDGARLALSTLGSLHLKEKPIEPPSLGSKLDHGLDAVQRGQSKHPSALKPK